MAIDKINPALAARTYASNLNVGQGSGIDAAPGNRFMDFLKDKVGDSIETIKEGERKSAQAITGEADAATIVQAATAAETTLQTVIAVRDRMIGAYQEIMRMPI